MLSWLTFSFFCIGASHLRIFHCYFALWCTIAYASAAFHSVALQLQFARRFHWIFSFFSDFNVADGCGPVTSRDGHWGAILTLRWVDGDLLLPQFGLIDGRSATGLLAMLPEEIEKVGSEPRQNTSTAMCVYILYIHILYICRYVYIQKVWIFCLSKSKL